MTVWMLLKVWIFVANVVCKTNLVDSANSEFLGKNVQYQRKHIDEIEKLHKLYKRHAILLSEDEVFLPLIGPRRPTAYCTGRKDSVTGESLNCCAGRSDACRVPFYDTTCYCDEFCYTNRNADCCPDYVSYCVRNGFATTTSASESETSYATNSTTLSFTSPATSLSTRSPSTPSKSSTVSTTETEATTVVSYEVCYNKGKGYRLGDKIRQNCNECICQRVTNGFYNFVCEENVCLIQPNLIEVINNGEYGWKSGNYSFFWGLTLRQGIRFRLGTKRAPKVVRNMPGITVNIDKVLPESFDARDKWPGYITEPSDQKNCGGSWAFSTASVASDRIAIQSHGKMTPHLSPQHLLSCHSKKKRKCEKTRVDKAWWFLRRKGLVSSECYPTKIRREGRIAPCSITSEKQECPSGSKNNHTYKTGPPYRIKNQEQHIMKEIMDNGPVQATMKVTRDFFYYKKGIYTPIPFGLHKVKIPKKNSFHSVKIIGWGVEENIFGSPTKYWIVQNSWGKRWGEKGYFRITKGSNTNQIENMILAVWAKLDQDIPIT